jgi:hypothetical protein
MARSQTNKQYTQLDIQRYLSGDMSVTEMHALESQALNDEMLADALEGYAAVKAEDARFDLDWLKEQIATKGSAKVVELQPKSRNRFGWWKLAAAASIVGMVFWMGKHLVGNENYYKRNGGYCKKTHQTSKYHR